LRGHGEWRFHRRASLVPVGTILGPILIVILVTFSTGTAATINVNTTADPGPTSDCSLRSAIIASLHRTATNGCPKGDGIDSIIFQAGLTGTITLTSPLGPITSGNVTISGPVTSPGIIIDATNSASAISVSHGATLVAKNLSFKNATDTAVAEINSTLELRLCDFDGNTTGTSGGGAVFGSGGVIEIADSTFSRNSSTLPGFPQIGGGAIFLSSPVSMTISGSTFDSNTSASDGGAILSDDSTISIVNSTFNQNASQASGGAIWDDSSTVLISASTFSGNTSGSGGGGAISNNDEYEFSLKSTIVSGKASGGNCAGEIDDAGYNLSDDASCGFSEVGSHNNTNAQLDPAGLQDNGGPTQTIGLKPHSPAIGAIPKAACTDQSVPPARITTDQRGYPRPSPQDGSGNAFCDIGAFEVQPPIDCAQAAASLPRLVSTPGVFFPELITGVRNPNGAFSINITGITQTKPVSGGGFICRDAFAIGGTAFVRANSQGGGALIYRISFSATDGHTRYSCTGLVPVCVQDLLHARQACVDTGQSYDSTKCGM
jgi:predicted outer membrane repeat protein